MSQADATEQTQNPLEFLGRQAARFGVEPKSLEARLNGERPEQVGAIMRGYLREGIEHDPLKAYNLLQESWLRFLFQDRQEIELDALKALVAIKGEPQSRFDDERYRLLEELIRRKHSHLTEIARAAEANNPWLAHWMYDKTNHPEEVARLAVETVQKDRKAAFAMVERSDDQNIRLRLVQKLLEAEGLAADDYRFALDKLRNVPWNEYVAEDESSPERARAREPKMVFVEERYAAVQELLGRIIQATMESEPAIAYEAAKSYKLKDTDREEKTLLMARISRNAVTKDPNTALECAGWLNSPPLTEEIGREVAGRYAETDPKTAFCALKMMHAQITHKDAKTFENRIVEAAMTMDPFLALSMAGEVRQCNPKLYERARSNLIMQRGISETHRVAEVFGARLPPNSFPLSRDADCRSIEELAELLCKSAAEERTAGVKEMMYRNARQLFENISKQLQVSDDERAARVEALKGELALRDDAVRISDDYTPAERIEAALQLAETKPLIAYIVLRSETDKSPRAKAAMGRLSELLEQKGAVEDAYHAEKAAQQPREDRLDSLRKALITKESSRTSWVTIPFGLREDARGRELFYQMRGRDLSLENRYTFAMETSRMASEDDKWKKMVEGLRENVLTLGLAEARRLFRSAKDPEGMALIEARLKAESPALEGNEGIMRRLLGLYAKHDAS